MADQKRMMKLHASILQVASIIKNNEQKRSADCSEMEKKKRERKANYSREETDRLVALVLKKKDILENKKGGSDQWQEKKQAWEDIEKAFNRKHDGTNYRDSKTLKIKYESIKRDIKRKWPSILAKKRNSNGKLPKFSEAEQKIKEIMQLPMDGLCDFDTMPDKSDDDDDSSVSSDNSNSSTKDKNWSAVKREIAESDEDTGCLEINTVVFEHKKKDDSLSDEEPPTKRIREDFQEQKKTNNNKADNLVDEKLQAVRLQKLLLKEEIEVKKLQKAMLEEEIVHKRTIFELEKQHLMLKIDALRNKD